MTSYTPYKMLSQCLASLIRSLISSFLFSSALSQFFLSSVRRQHFEQLLKNAFTNFPRTCFFSHLLQHWFDISDGRILEDLTSIDIKKVKTTHYKFNA